MHRFGTEESLTNIAAEADAFSLQNQKSYLFCLRVLALIGMAMVAAFLFYDELDLSGMIFVYALLLLAGALVLYHAEKNRYHRNYIHYRLLAEVLRVQRVLDLAGIAENAASFFSYTMRDETNWIYEIIESHQHESKCIPAEELEEIWIRDQYAYHLSAQEKVARQLKVNNTVSTVLNVFLFILVPAVCILEVLPGVDLLMNIGSITIKGYILIAVGLFSAVSLFLSGYYGKLNLERKVNDHLGMAKLYEEVLHTLKDSPLTKELILQIAREEILENGNWYSYMKEKKLTLDL